MPPGHAKIAALPDRRRARATAAATHGASPDAGETQVRHAAQGVRALMDPVRVDLVRGVRLATGQRRVAGNLAAVDGELPPELPGLEGTQPSVEHPGDDERLVRGDLAGSHRGERRVGTSA
jgi:hypothetical protein